MLVNEMTPELTVAAIVSTLGALVVSRIWSPKSKPWHDSQPGWPNSGVDPGATSHAWSADALPVGCSWFAHRFDWPATRADGLGGSAIGA